MSASTLEGQNIGKYRVLEALGRGGMARVYRAYHPQLDRYVAIKVLRSDLIDETDLLARFQREARAIASLRHPNIVQVFDFDTQDDIYYMVMELLEGDSLRARLNNFRTDGKRMPLPEILAITKSVLSGLGFAHSQGIIHRDIKPANIMLTNRGEAVLTDFGIAQILGSTQLTVSGALMGTLNYMAPEQGLQGHCDQRSDLYSLGIVYYEMLTGYTPFDADTPLAILLKHLNDPLPLPRQIDPALPPELERIALRALSKDPADRYQSAEEMTAALDEIKVEALPVNPRELLPHPSELDQNAVFSGTSRQKITDQRFAKLDTDPDLAGTLKSSQTATQNPGTGSPANQLQTAPAKRVSTSAAVLSGLSVILFFNFLATMILTLNGINVFSRGWAFELFLLGGFLAVIMWAVEIHWLLIPIIMIFGITSILAYTAITGRWGDWAFLWFLVLLIIGQAIIVPVRMNQNPTRLKTQARTWGSILMLLSVVLASLTCLLTGLVTLLQKAF